MRNKIIEIGTKQIIINIDSEPYYSNNKKNLFFYGFPLYKDFDEIDISNIINHQYEIEGYYLFVGFNSDELLICTDICSGFRIYYHIQNNQIFISDSVEKLLQMIKKTFSDLSFNKNEYRYFEKHGYTTGGDTFFHEIKKLPPSSYLKITSEGIKQEPTFKNICRKPSFKKHLDKLDESLKNTLSQLKAMDGKKVLFFSGGKDSTLLALVLKELSIPFTAVYLEAIPQYKENFKDKLRAEHVAKSIGIEFETIKINTELINDELSEEIAKIFPFDEHFYAMHYLSIKQLKKTYGDNLILINGQSSDAVFSFGTSEQSFGHMFAGLTYRKNFKLKFILNTILKSKHGNNYYVPKNKPDFFMSFLDNYKNMAILNKNENCEFYNYFAQIIQNFLKYNYTTESLLMLLKIYSYLQGPDNQTVIKSALDNGIIKVILPYSAPNVIYNTIKYKSNLKEILVAKYPVNLLIKRKLTKKIDSISNFDYPEGIQEDLSNIKNNPRMLIRSNAKRMKETSSK